MAGSIRRLPSLNGLRAFEVASRHLNFRIAAEELGVTQGAVAQQVRGLEAEIGMKLFERHPRTLALTDAGRSYVTSIRRAFELISEATGTLRPEPFHLTISVTPTFASKWRPDLELPDGRRRPRRALRPPAVRTRAEAQSHLASLRSAFPRFFLLECGRPDRRLLAPALP
jgi:DNA-binding transcriptional LysR family regulator